jgi:hypothetical protein
VHSCMRGYLKKDARSSAACIRLSKQEDHVKEKVAIGRSGVDGLGSFERKNTKGPVGCCCYQALEGVYDSGGDISNAGVVYFGFLRYSVLCL